MKGEHKIFKLESNLHNAAKKTAKKGPALWLPWNSFCQKTLDFVIYINIGQGFEYPLSTNVIIGREW